VLRRQASRGDNDRIGMLFRRQSASRSASASALAIIF
jgi:hypothetical protein